MRNGEPLLLVPLTHPQIESNLVEQVQKDKPKLSGTGAYPDTLSDDYQVCPGQLLY